MAIQYGVARYIELKGYHQGITDVLGGDAQMIACWQSKESITVELVVKRAITVECTVANQVA